MTIETAADLAKLKRVSLSLKRFFIAMFAFTCMAPLINFFGEPAPISLVGIPFSGEMVTSKVQGLWILSQLMWVAIALKALYHLIKLFGLYAQARIFTSDNVAQIRQLGVTLLLMPAAWLIVLVAAAPEIADMVEQWTMIMPSFPGNALISGAIVILVSWIMDVGRQLREDSDLVI